MTRTEADQRIKTGAEAGQLSGEPEVVGVSEETEAQIQERISQYRQETQGEARRLKELSESDPEQLFVGRKETLDAYRTSAMAIITREISSLARYGRTLKRWGITDDLFMSDRFANIPPSIIYSNLELEPGQISPLKADGGLEMIPYVWAVWTDTAESLERKWQLEDERKKAGDFQISAADFPDVMLVVEFFNPALPNYKLGYPEWKNALPAKAGSFQAAMQILLRIGFVTKEEFGDPEMLEEKVRGLVAAIRRGNPMIDLNFDWDMPDSQEYDDEAQ